MTRIYNYATIEASRPMTGPGFVIGVIAMPTDQYKIKGKLRSWESLESIGKSLGIESKDKAPKLHTVIEDEISAKMTLAGQDKIECIDMFRSLTAPRQSLVRFVARGTRYCKDSEINEMLTHLYNRFVSEIPFQAESETANPVDFSVPEMM